MTDAAPDRSAFTRHGGRVAAAQALYPDAPRPWIDLSRGVNPHPYPVARAPRTARTRLPDPGALRGLEATAAKAFGADPAKVAAAPGSEILIRLLPHLLNVRSVAIAPPTYGGHAEAWAAAGAEIVPFPAPAMVVVNPNNPDGRRVEPAALRAAADAGTWVIADEAFADVDPSVSVAAEAGGRLIVLRSFGKFFGLPGLRLGFMIADPELIGALRQRIGDWPVSGDAIAAGLAAYGDTGWAERTRRRLAASAERLDALLTAAGLTVLGGTSLFRLTRSPGAPARFDALARAGLLCRPFDYDPALLRFGLPGSPRAWARLKDALGGPHVR